MTAPYTAQEIERIAGIFITRGKEYDIIGYRHDNTCCPINNALRLHSIKHGLPVMPKVQRVCTTFLQPHRSRVMHTPRVARFIQQIDNLGVRAVGRAQAKEAWHAAKQEAA